MLTKQHKREQRLPIAKMERDIDKSIKGKNEQRERGGKRGQTFSHSWSLPGFAFASFTPSWLSSTAGTNPIKTFCRNSVHF